MMERSIAVFLSTIDLIEHLVKQSPTRPTRLIICSTKADFLAQLLPPLCDPPSSTVPQEIPSSQDSEQLEIDPTKSPPTPHPLLTPTLALLAATRSIKLSFCPSISTLRAYLAGHVFPQPEPTVVILGLIQLHHSTSEFSAQGLSRTLASAVSAAARAKSPYLRLVECVDILDPSNPYRGSRIWDAHVPLLSGSVKIGGDGASWAGRTITVRRVASRWFQFEQDRDEYREAAAERSLRRETSEEKMLI